MTDPAAAPQRISGKYLAFGLADEVYGLQILKVQEIIGLMSITRVPGLSDSVRGVINLRGKVIPVVDLRRRLGLPEQADTDRTCIVVVRVTRDGAAVTVGLLVDEVREVLAVTDEQIEPVPDFGASVDITFLLGMAKAVQKVVMLLDVDRVLSSAELWAAR